MLFRSYLPGKGETIKAGGDRIPLRARILAVASAYDSLVSATPSGKGLSHKQAIKSIVDDSGIRFDPHVAGAFLSVLKRKELTID